ncbi:MAG: hypothetical protein VX899_04045 [Myxococcota bacterium]|nr:hypothetical protein [Myxococcota bacterium]
MLLLLLSTLSLGQAPAPRLRATAPPRLPSERPSELQRVQHLMRRGGHAKALTLLPALLDTHPAAPGLYLRARIATGHCADGVPGLAELPQLYDAAFAESMARCHASWHQWSQAADWMLESDALARKGDPDRSAVTWWYLARAGREEEAAALHDHMAVHAPLNTTLPLLMARLCFERGQTDRGDTLLRALPPELQADRTNQRTLARLELDLGNPAAAAEHARSALRQRAQDPRARALLAESLRRSGWPQGAAHLLEQAQGMVAHHPDLQAVHMRVLVDLGAPREALAFHAAHAPEHQGPHPELVASLWYAAVAMGDAKEAQRWARQWDAWNESPLRSLEQL